MALNIDGSNISVEHITFDGNNNSTRTNELIGFAGSSNVNIEKCTIKNSTYIGLAIGGSTDVYVGTCRFENNGRPKPTTESAPALWCEQYGPGNNSKNVTVDSCYFVNNEWSAAYFMPDGGSFTNNHCINNGESTVFSNSNGKYIRIENNYITGATISNRSASGLELGGSNYIVSGNVISFCDADGISITAGQNYIVEGNTCFNNGQKSATVPAFQLAAGIAFSGEAATRSSDLIITNNRCYDNQTTQTQVIGIFAYAANPEYTAYRILITNNNLYNNKTYGFRNHNNYSVALVTGTTTASVIYNNIGNSGVFNTY